MTDTSSLKDEICVIKTILHKVDLKEDEVSDLLQKFSSECTKLKLDAESFLENKTIRMDSQSTNSLRDKLRMMNRRAGTIFELLDDLEQHLEKSLEEISSPIVSSPRGKLPDGASIPSSTSRLVLNLGVGCRQEIPNPAIQPNQSKIIDFEQAALSNSANLCNGHVASPKSPKSPSTGSSVDKSAGEGAVVVTKQLEKSTDIETGEEPDVIRFVPTKTKITNDLLYHNNSEGSESAGVKPNCVPPPFFKQATTSKETLFGDLMEGSGMLPRFGSEPPSLRSGLSPVPCRMSADEALSDSYSDRAASNHRALSNSVAASAGTVDLDGLDDFDPLAPISTSKDPPSLRSGLTPSPISRTLSPASDILATPQHVSISRDQNNSTDTGFALSGFGEMHSDATGRELNSVANDAISLDEMDPEQMDAVSDRGSSMGGDIVTRIPAKPGSGPSEKGTTSVSTGLPPDVLSQVQTGLGIVNSSPPTLIPPAVAITSAPMSLGRGRSRKTDSSAQPGSVSSGSAGNVAPAAQPGSVSSGSAGNVAPAADANISRSGVETTSSSADMTPVANWGGPPIDWNLSIKPINIAKKLRFSRASISFAVSPSEIWCFLSNSSALRLTDDLNIAYEDWAELKRQKRQSKPSNLSLPADRIRPGQYCGAPYPADLQSDPNAVRYFRGRILDLAENGFGNWAKVFYVDYGNCCWVCTETLRTLELEHANSFLFQPWQVIPCRLAGLKPLNGMSWSNAEIARFNTFIQSMNDFNIVITALKDTSKRGNTVIDVMFSTDNLPDGSVTPADAELLSLRASLEASEVGVAVEEGLENSGSACEWWYPLDNENAIPNGDIRICCKEPPIEPQLWQLTGENVESQMTPSERSSTGNRQSAQLPQDVARQSDGHPNVPGAGPPSDRMLPTIDPTNVIPTVSSGNVDRNSTVVGTSSQHTRVERSGSNETATSDPGFLTSEASRSPGIANGYGAGGEGWEGGSSSNGSPVGQNNQSRRQSSDNNDDQLSDMYDRTRARLPPGLTYGSRIPDPVIAINEHRQLEFILSHVDTPGLFHIHLVDNHSSISDFSGDGSKNYNPDLNKSSSSTCDELVGVTPELSALECEMYRFYSDPSHRRWFEIQSPNCTDDPGLVCVKRREDGRNNSFYRGRMIRIEMNHSPPQYERQSATNVLVQRVDYGDAQMESCDNLFYLEKRFCQLPRQSIRCSLEGIVPFGRRQWLSEARSRFLAHTGFDMKHTAWVSSKAGEPLKLVIPLKPTLVGSKPGVFSVNDYMVDIRMAEKAPNVVVGDDSEKGRKLPAATQRSQTGAAAIPITNRDQPGLRPLVPAGVTHNPLSSPNQVQPKPRIPSIDSGPFRDVYVGASMPGSESSSLQPNVSDSTVPVGPDRSGHTAVVEGHIRGDERIVGSQRNLIRADVAGRDGQRPGNNSEVEDACGFAKMRVPPTGSQVLITPISVLSPCQFYATHNCGPVDSHGVTPEGIFHHNEQRRLFIDQMNTFYSNPNIDPIDHVPQAHEFVIVKLEGGVVRGRVTSVQPAAHTCKIFAVDDGLVKLANLGDLYPVVPEFCAHAMQAVPIALAGVKQLPGSVADPLYKERRAKFRQHITGQSLEATVVSSKFGEHRNNDTLIVDLNRVSENGQEEWLNEWVISQGLAEAEVQ